ncbi:zinc ribbon domain-containing protein [Limosilactobacillus fermentum]|uniref:zinc ribbon domain-containing protein n=1 Tax=Limosilactobacillus fermentum TaxID=1613 RepID=UPI0021822D6C|nr:zinc ribbon domain-containing protein [Limosilactobacillus fermentum]MCS8610536.1 zinc ribbon domain-containing protein [Limosilactobacillus fermentum]MCT3465080.1 zinc ribbon domain-containing protein [Limosilactobacillus fermentum]
MNFRYCPHCGSKLSVDAQFCTQCGAKLDPINTKTEHDKSSSENITKYFILGIILLVFFGFIGNRLYQQHLAKERSDIKSIVFKELNSDYFTVQVDTDEQIVTIKPTNYEAKVIIGDGDDLDVDDTMEDSVVNISKKIQDNIGDDWVIEVTNPFNSDRVFWKVKNGKVKYRIQDHLDYYYYDD